MEQEHVEYNGMVYDNTAVDLLCDLTKEKISILNREITECADEISKLVRAEKKMLAQVTSKANETTECSVYGAPDAAGLLEKYVEQELEEHHKKLTRCVTKLAVRCAQRYELQHMLGRCSMLCTVADDDEDYDYREDE